MKFPRLQRRTLMLFAIIALLAILLVYVAVRSGPFAPIQVTVATVESRSVAPALFGIGTVEARYTYQIGPTVAGRVKEVNVHVGDGVQAGQVLGEMDPIDLDDRIRAQQAAIASARAALAQAQATQAFAEAQGNRYQELLRLGSTSAEMAAVKRQDLAAANASLQSARENVSGAEANLKALRAQRANLLLVAPVAGLVTARDVDPGTTVVAGQPVVEMIDPASIWVAARFDQTGAEGLAAELPASIVLRSRAGQSFAGHVLRIEPLADAVTEETRAKIVFDKLPAPLPPIGELAEVTAELRALPAAPTIPNAALHVRAGERGVWKLANGDLQFIPVTLGRTDLGGNVQVLKGLTAGERIVVYSERALAGHSRIHVVQRLPGGPA